MNVLHIGYNMHSLYYFSAGHLFERLKCGVFEETKGLAVATIGYPVPTIIKPWYFWAPLVGHTGPWDAIRSRLSEPEVDRMAALLVGGVLISYVVINYFLQLRLLQRQPFANVSSQWAMVFGVKKSAFLLGVVALVACHFIAMAVTPPTFPKKLGQVVYSLVLFATFLIVVRVLGWIVYQHQAVPGSPILSLADGKWLFASLVILWSVDIAHPVYEYVFGRGPLTVILHGFFGIMFIFGNATSLVARLATTSPLNRAVGLGPRVPSVQTLPVPP